MQKTPREDAQKSQTTAPPQRLKYRTGSPSYLYLKGSIYYFRHVFKEDQKRKYQRTELRLTLTHVCQRPKNIEIF